MRGAELLDEPRPVEMLGLVPPAPVDPAFAGEGLEEARRSGLGRALFCVRLLELEGRTTPEERLAFLIGAFVGAEMELLLARGRLAPGTAIAVAGDEKVGGAWTVALEDRGLAPQSIAPSEVEAGLIAGLTAIVEARVR